MIKQIQKKLVSSPVYVNLLERLQREKSATLSEQSSGFTSLLATFLANDGFFPVLLFENERLSEHTLENLISFNSDDCVAWLPFFDYNSELFNNSRFENHFARMTELLRNNKLSFMVTSVSMLSHTVQNPFQTNKNVLTLEKNRDYSFDWLISRFSEYGYQRTERVEFTGNFCVRGGIVDIYPFGSPLPYRLEFYGNSLESIRAFHPDTQLSINETDSFILFPSSSSFTSRIPFIELLPDNALLINCSSLPMPATSHYRLCFQKDSVNDSFHVLDLPRFAIIDSRNASVKSFIQKYKTVCIFWQNKMLLDELQRVLKGFPNCCFIKGTLQNSFVLGDIHSAFVSDYFFFQREHLFNPETPFIPDVERVSRQDSIKYGDAVVHVDYGIGFYLGTRFSDGDEQLIIEYENQDKVYVPVRHIDKIYRFSREQAQPVRADSLNSRTWELKHKRIKRAVSDITDELVKLYQIRTSKAGLSIEGESIAEREVELSFPWEETRDQMMAIETVKSDMSRPVIMDRLICGDVGFGKTEVAIRAAFRAVISGYQVAILVPTTILSIQHFETFRDRLSFFGVNIEILNRFQSDSIFKRIQKDLVNGNLDILIGTHRLLSNKLFFNNLGLLIIDEEQRFGVRHKEKIQSMRNNVDVLTLSATPIPRTLQLSLTGIRDVTRIDTPPKERTPIYTKIIHWDSTLIKQTIRDELKRGGQVFIVNNNISDLPALAANIQELIPESSVRFAHGQLSGKILEKQLLDFLHHRYDILISTTIIESGIDIPNANTLIVMNAHQFGLSQLYQIRGRVGRSFRKAYAYLVIPRHRHINPGAMQRLKALEYYTDLGSGYQIAIRDLELRGAGNLFGTEQSGHIDQVGYSYFLKLLTDEIERRTGKTFTDTVQPEIFLSYKAYIPEHIVSSGATRLEIYQSIAAAKNMETLSKIRLEIVDRFGKIPWETENLLLLRHISLEAQQKGISRIEEKENACHIVFNHKLTDKELKSRALKMIHALKDKQTEYYLKTKGNFSLVLRFDKGDDTERLKLLLETIMSENKLEF